MQVRYKSYIKGEIVVEFMKQLNMQILSFIILIGALFLIFRDWSSEEEKVTRTTMNIWAEKLDRNVKPSGVYIQWESNTLPEKDAWGTPLNVTYKNEGVAERLFIDSAGEDKSWSTKDDLRVSKMQINAKGIGEGVKEHAAEVVKEATKGASEEWKGNVKELSAEAAKGLIKGLKEEFTKSDEE